MADPAAKKSGVARAAELLGERIYDMVLDLDKSVGRHLWDSRR